MSKAFRFCHQFVKKYGHGFWIVLYMIFYMLGFMILENAGHRHYHVIHTIYDDMIPFCEYFIIPYYLWFAYIAVGVLYFIFLSKSKREYYKLTSSLAIGMTIFLIVSCIYPNRQDLRPEVFINNNIFTQMVKMLYATDTPTNILPSIHVFNSLAVYFAIRSSERLEKHHVIKAAAGILTVAIILSTMFLKQHSVVDVSMGILMGFAVQMFVDHVFSQESETMRGKVYKY